MSRQKKQQKACILDTEQQGMMRFKSVPESRMLSDSNEFWQIRNATDLQTGLYQNQIQQPTFISDQFAVLPF